MNQKSGGVGLAYKHAWLRFFIVLAVLLILGLFLEHPPLNAAHSAGRGLSTSTLPTDNTGWPSTYLGDNGRSNFNGAETTITPSTASTLQPVWEQSITKDPISAQPVIANGLLYWGSWSGYEYASDPTTGKVAWSTLLWTTQYSQCNPPQAGVASTPTVTTITIGGQPTSVLFVGGGNSQFYALNALTGAIIWQQNLGGGIKGTFIWSSPAVYNSSVYIGLSSFGDCPLIQGKFFQLDAATGNILNTFNTVPGLCTGASVWGSPTIDEQTGMLYFATGNGAKCGNKKNYSIALIELQASNLSFVADWKVPHQKGDNDFGSTPTLFQATINGTLHQMIGLINKNGAYYAFDRSNIAAGPLWQDQLAYSKSEGGQGDDISSSAWDGTTLYVAANTTAINGQSCTASLRAINPADGSFLWQDCLNGTPQWDPVMAVPGVVVVGAGSTLYVVNASDGSTLISLASTGAKAIFDGSATISNGVLYAGDYHGHLYAFAPSGSIHV